MDNNLDKTKIEIANKLRIAEDIAKSVRIQLRVLEHEILSLHKILDNVNKRSHGGELKQQEGEVTLYGGGGPKEKPPGSEN